MSYRRHKVRPRTRPYPAPIEILETEAHRSITYLIKLAGEEKSTVIPDRFARIGPYFLTERGGVHKLVTEGKFHYLMRVWRIPFYVDKYCAAGEVDLVFPLDHRRRSVNVEVLGDIFPDANIDAMRGISSYIRYSVENLRFKVRNQ